MPTYASPTDAYDGNRVGKKFHEAHSVTYLFSNTHFGSLPSSLIMNPHSSATTTDIYTTFTLIFWFSNCKYLYMIKWTFFLCVCHFYRCCYCFWMLWQCMNGGGEQCGKLVRLSFGVKFKLSEMTAMTTTMKQDEQIDADTKFITTCAWYIIT